MRAKSIEPVVLQILIDSKESRDSDNILYANVLKEFGNKNGIDFSRVSILGAYSRDMRCGNLVIPPFKTVERCRRKIQEENPDLRSSKSVKIARDQEEIEYKEYARN